MYKFIRLIILCGIALHLQHPANGVNHVQSGPKIIDTAHYYMEHSYDVLKYTLSFDFHANYTAPYPKSFSAKEKILFRADSILSSIKVNAVATSLVIDSVGLDASTFTHADDTLYIQLDQTYQVGDTVEVSISYHHLSVIDNAFYCSAGVLFTDFPPENARKVFPCWDRPSDKALTDITAKVPLNVRLGATGALADSVVSGDTIWYHWVSQDPVSTYLVTLTSKNTFLIHKQYWKKLSNPSDSIPVLLYYKNGEFITPTVSVIEPLTDFFSEKFGDYPFEKIGFATLTSLFPWGGMENQSMVNLMPGGYSNTSLIAHEHSHQWFGDLITCGTWADIWLNEGFGTYCDALWTEENTGYAFYYSKIKTLANNYQISNPGIPIYNPMWAIQTPSANLLYNTAISYNKGACVLYQLREVLGDSLFFDVMNAYATDPAYRFGNAVTEDFISVVNDVTGEDYQWFFDEWIYHPNHPVYENVFNIVYEGNNQWSLTFRINQIQQNTCFFRMPADILVEFQDGSDTTLNVLNDSNNQLFQFSFIKEPILAEFDPEDKIILKEASTVAGIHENEISENFRLLQNHPNPFTTTTLIEYYLGVRANVLLELLNGEGKVIKILANSQEEPGWHEVVADLRGFAPGIYYYRMQSGTSQSTRRMIFIK